MLPSRRSSDPVVRHDRRGRGVSGTHASSPNGRGLGPEQHDPITVTFSKPVYQLIVTHGGAFQCSGTYGSVTRYNTQGRQVEQSDFTLYYPEDCGADNVTCCAVDTLHFPGGIAQLLITPPQPWSWVACDPPDWCQEGHTYTGLAYSFYEQRPPTADSCLTGDELLDQLAMRDMLKAAWDSSNADDIPANRRERRATCSKTRPGTLFTDSISIPRRIRPVRVLSRHSAPCLTFLLRMDTRIRSPLGTLFSRRSAASRRRRSMTR